MTRTLTTRNDAIFDQLEAFVVTTPANEGALEPAPFGIPTRWTVSPYVAANGPFFDLLQKLDGLTFGPEGMPMDKWVFYNCAELPGFIYGFALEASAMTAAERALMEVPAGYEGPVPFSMYIAIPMHEEGAWFGHNLASLNRTFPHRRLGGLATITKAVALEAFRVRRFVGATQWASKALYIHTRFGPLTLQTTWTPAHSTAATLTYAFDPTDAALRYAAGDPAARLHFPPPDLHLDATDTATAQALQARIEAGESFELVGPPSVEGGRVLHPIRTVPRAR